MQRHPSFDAVNYLRLRHQISQVIRNYLLEYLHRKAVFREFGSEFTERLATRVAEKLIRLKTGADSQAQYINLRIPEERLNTLMPAIGTPVAPPMANSEAPYISREVLTLSHTQVASQPAIRPSFDPNLYTPFLQSFPPPEQQQQQQQQQLAAYFSVGWRGGEMHAKEGTAGRIFTQQVPMLSSALATRGNAEDSPRMGLDTSRREAFMQFRSEPTNLAEFSRIGADSHAQSRAHFRLARQERKASQRAGRNPHPPRKQSDADRNPVSQDALRDDDDDDRNNNKRMKVATVESSGDPQLRNDIREILLLSKHIWSCSRRQGECGFPYCASVKQSFIHTLRCNDKCCENGCSKFDSLFDHCSSCRKSNCVYCELLTKFSEEGKVSQGTDVEDTQKPRNEDNETSPIVRMKCASLLDTFTVEELEKHIKSLEHCGDEREGNTEQPHKCNLCGKGELLFEPPPRFCASCSSHISTKGNYYVDTTRDGNRSLSICERCYKHPGKFVRCLEENVPKSKLEKRSNYAETDASAELWIQCSKCEAQLHQICALFNEELKEEEAEYICPRCRIKDMVRSGKHETSEPSHVFRAAKDLPRTTLGDHIEERLFRRLRQDRERRASALEKNIEEVAGAEDLTVRVVSSIDKLCEVKPLFRDLFEGDIYPSQFPYKSKAIMLFQKIDCADVCIFVMYVQEYGPGCALPNRRHVYVSYIDSVKYFRPEIAAATGEALRTFVYHEILIGYLECCKKRGFVSCSIWACPSFNRGDYILYCHPPTQKIPKHDKLRKWYNLMIEKATEEGIVVENKKLFDSSFQSKPKSRGEQAAAHLPYCDGDYWPDMAEKLLEREDASARKRRTSGAGGRITDDPAGNIEDRLFMKKLKEAIQPARDDLLMIYLQRPCDHCCSPILSAKWTCISCENFQLCDRCQSTQKDEHAGSSKEQHFFERADESDIPNNDDEDENMETEFFDSRSGFLDFCRRSSYQFDTLRRAKHATMMILRSMTKQKSLRKGCEKESGRISANPYDLRIQKNSCLSAPLILEPRDVKREGSGAPADD